MVVTGVSPEFREPLLSQVGRIVNSEVLRGSESLCQLLAYLASYAINNPGTSAKEHQIATEVLGRATDFDPRLDSTVRVQTSRLRNKLAEYYAGPGAGDPIVVEIPRGAYGVAVHSRLTPQMAAPAQENHRTEVITIPEHQPATDPASEPLQERRPRAIWILSMICFGLLLSLIYFVLYRPAKTVEPRLSVAVPAGLRTLWHPFIEAPERTWVVFSNAEFIGRPEIGMRYFDPIKDKGGAVLDYYTGIGEVMAIHELDQLFGQFRHGVLVKRGLLLAMDDVKNNDLVFVGSPSENLTLRDLPANQEFVFRVADSGPRKGDLGIVNLNPLSGEQPAYFGSEHPPFVEDYAVIGLLRGPTKRHWNMSLAGTSTIGTQAAVEYVCSDTSAEQLLKIVGGQGGDPKPFEALIRVKVSRGVPVSSDLVTVHVRKD